MRTGDESKFRQDVTFRATGVGMDHRRNCWGCSLWRGTAGGKGVGLRWRCAACLAAKAKLVQVAA